MLLIEALLISNKPTSFFISFIQITFDIFVLCRFFVASGIVVEVVHLSLSNVSQNGLHIADSVAVGFANVKRPPHRHFDFIIRVHSSSPLATGPSRGSAFVSRLELLINVVLIFGIFNVVCEIFLRRGKGFLSFDVSLLLWRCFIVSGYT